METDTIVVDLAGRYVGWQATCKTDPAWGFFKALVDGDLGRIGRGLLRQVVSWNFKTDDGQLAPLTEEGLDNVPMGALQQLLTLYGDAYRTLPNPSAGS